jgi:hypothetical protein
MISNEELKNKLQQKFPKQKFNMVRYTYILQNVQGEILLINSNQEDFPGQTFFKTWEIFSDTYYYTDLFKEDNIEMAKEVINQRTGLSISTKDIYTIDLCSFKRMVNYNDIVLHAFPKNKNVTEKLTFLNIYYYIKNIDTKYFEYWSDREDEFIWIEKKSAVNKIGIAHDRQAITNILTNNFQPPIDSLS